MEESHQKNKGDYANQVSALRQSMEAPARGFSRTQTMTLVMVGLVVVLGLGWLFLRNDTPGAVPILITPFEASGLSENEEWQLVATEQALIAYLEASGRLRLEREENVLSLPTSSAAEWRMSGHLTGTGDDRLILRVELQSLTNEYTSFAADVPGIAENLNDMTQRAAGQVFAWSGQNLLSEPEILLAQAELPMSDRALQYLSEGRAAFAARDDRSAINSLESAARIAGPHPMIYNEMSRAWNRLGYRPRALETAEIALENKGQLSRQRQLEIEAQYYNLNHDWQGEQEAWQALKAFHPQALDYRLALAKAYLRGSDIEKAQQTIDSMKALPAPVCDDLRIDLIEAEMWFQNGHFDQGTVAADRALTKARAAGNDGLLGEAILQLVDFMDEDSEALLEEAERIFLRLGNHARLAEVYGEQGKLKRISGELETAEMLYSRAIALARDIGDESNVAALQNGFSIVYDLMGRQTDSLQLKQNLADYFSERGITNRYAIMKENIGISLFKLGRLAEAETAFADALPLFAEVNDTIGLAWAPYHLSRIRSRQGELVQAQSLAEEALENSRDNPEGDLAGNTGFELAHLMFFRGEFDAAIEKFGEVKAGYLSYENNVGAAEADLMLARIYIRLDRLEDAETALTSAIKVFDGDALPNYQLDARTVQLDWALAAESDEADEICQSLHDRIEGLEFQEFVLRARTRLALCDMLGTYVASEELSPEARLALVREQSEALGLFEPVLHSHLIEIRMANEGDETQTKEQALTWLRSFAEETGFSLSGYVPAET